MFNFPKYPVSRGTTYINDEGCNVTELTCIGRGRRHVNTMALYDCKFKMIAVVSSLRMVVTCTKQIILYLKFTKKDLQVNTSAQR